MNQERHQFLTLRQSPARLNAEETAWFMGFLPHEIPILIAARLLKPLGNPVHNSTKYFSTVQLEQLRADPVWLSKASDALMRYWKAKNNRRRSRIRRIEDAHSPNLITTSP